MYHDHRGTDCQNYDAVGYQLRLAGTRLSVDADADADAADESDIWGMRCAASQLSAKVVIYDGVGDQKVSYSRA